MISKYLAAVAAIALSSSAQAASFVNGSFELGTNPGQFSTFTAGQTDITGWTIGSGSVDYIGSYWAASNGLRSIDLAGNAAGLLSQTFDTVIGRTYRVNFDLWANDDGGTFPRLAFVNVGAGDLTFSSNGGGTKAAPNWVTQTFSFVASATSTTLSFRADSISANTFFGPALDNVSVSAIPEPATWALMLGGFGLVGGAMRSRRRANATVSA